MTKGSMVCLTRNAARIGKVLDSQFEGKLLQALFVGTEIPVWVYISELDEVSSAQVRS